MITDLHTIKNEIETGIPSFIWAVTSGGYDPLHPGHISSFEQAKPAILHHIKNCRFDLSFKWFTLSSIKLIVLVNGNEFLMNKKGYKFMDEADRCRMVDAVRWVDYVAIHRHGQYGDSSFDTTVCSSLEYLLPDYFIKGGDRVDTNTPEGDLCKKLNIHFLTGVGEEKRLSSSGLVNAVKTI